MSLARSLWPRPWMCRPCLSHHSLQPIQYTSRPLLQTGHLASYATRPQPVADKPKPKKLSKTLIFLALVAVGSGYIAFSENGRFVGGAVERSGRVGYTLYKCINDYRRTINKREENDAETYDAMLKACHKRCADRTFQAMELNGSIFIKLGQHLTSLNYMLPSEWCDTFIPLQDKCPVSSFKAVRDMVEKDTGQAFDDMFSEFEEVPLGAASLAQVHRAIDNQSGEKVAVKLQHPILDYWAPLDLSLTAFAFRAIKRAFPEYDLTWLSDEMQNSMPQELDFVTEGENARRAKEFFKDVKSIPLVIPTVMWAKRRILVMEYITGHRPDDLEYLDANSISRDEVSATLARTFNTMIFTPGAPLHCDPHGGNIAIRVNNDRRKPLNFDVILYDHGLYRTIPLDLQRNYANLWLAVLDGDMERMRKYAKVTANISDEDFPLFASAITGRDYRVVSSDISASRTAEEKENMSEVLSGGLLQQLVRLLGKVPSIILLILKTNDLTRSLDTNLQTRQGPMRSFLILARYAAETVFNEKLEQIRSTGSLLWPPQHAASLLVAWMQYTKTKLKLEAYEWYLFSRGLFGFTNAMSGGLEG